MRAAPPSVRPTRDTLLGRACGFGNSSDKLQARTRGFVNAAARELAPRGESERLPQCAPASGCSKVSSTSRHVVRERYKLRLKRSRGEQGPLVVSTQQEPAVSISSTDHRHSHPAC